MSCSTDITEDCVPEVVLSTPKGKDVQSSTHRGYRRTPYSATRKVNSSFKSPASLRQSPSHPTDPQNEIRLLRKTLAELNSEISLLEKDGYREEELEQHIDLLHEYNDIKDIGQALLGRLASLRGVTTADLYPEFDLELDD